MSETDENKVNTNNNDGTRTVTEISPQAPASNPGSDDPSAGIAAGSGGVSSAAYVLSPVPTEQKSMVQSTVETVKSYLPSLGSLGLGGTKTEDPEASNVEGDKEGSSGVKGAAGAAAGGVAAAASSAAVAVGLKSDGDAPTDSADTNASSTSKDEAMTDSSPKDDTTKSDTANEVAQAKDEDKSTDIAPTDKANEVSTAKTDTEGAAPGEGGGGSEETSGGNELQKSKTPRENRDAIPTAGGERLGDKHWGESKIVPDVPKPQEETPQVSSEEGQPDKATQDNTAQNTGGAPPPSSSTPTSGAADDGDKEKMGFRDKVKAKLNIGSKD